MVVGDRSSSRRHSIFRSTSVVSSRRRPSSGFVMGSLVNGSGLAEVGRLLQAMAGHGESGEATREVRRVSGGVRRSPKSWWQAMVAVRVVRAGRPPAEDWTPWQGVTRLGS